MKFSPEFIERVAEANNLVDVISQYTQLRPTGGGFMGRCPFPDHPEKTPSFSVSEAKQVYHCFGCHKKGNIFSFLQEYNGMSFRDAVEYLANRAHIPMPIVDQNRSEQEDQQTKQKKLLLRVNQLAQFYFRESFKRLPSNHPVKLYVQKRQLSETTVETFQLGYASEEWDGLTKFLESKKVPLELAEQARLIKSRSQGKTGHFDIFRDRLIFPIQSAMGDVVAFGGRIILQGEPKYLNSPETLVFYKGKTLYGLNETAKYIRSEDLAIVVEGYMDLVALYQAGIKNVVATMGTALTSEHARMISRSTKNVLVLFDGDAAGREAAERSLPILLGADLFPKGLILPDDMDPDDFIKAKGVSALQKLISESGELFQQILNQWLIDYRGEAAKKVQVAGQIGNIFEVIKNPSLKSLYLTEAAQKLGVDEKWLKEAITKRANVSPGNTGVVGNSSLSGSNSVLGASAIATSEPRKSVLGNNFSDEEKIKLVGASKAEIGLLGLVLKNYNNMEQFLKADIQSQILHSGIQEVLKRIEGVYRQAPEKFGKLTSLLTNFVDKPEYLFPPDILISPAQMIAKAGIENQTADVASAEGGLNLAEGVGAELGFDETTEVSEKEIKFLADCITKIKEQFIEHQIKTLTLELKRQADVEKLQKLQELKKEALSIRNRI